MHKLSDNPPKNLRGKCSEGSSWGERRDLPTTRVPIPVLGLYPIRTNVTVKRKVRRAVILPCRSRPAPVNFPHELGPLGTPLFFFFFLSVGSLSATGRLLTAAFSLWPRRPHLGLLENSKKLPPCRRRPGGPSLPAVFWPHPLTPLRPYKFHRETQSPAGRHFYRAGPGQLR